MKLKRPVLREDVKRRILRLADSYPQPRSALLPALDLLHRSAGGRLVPTDVAETARLLGIPVSTAWGAASSYALFRTSPPCRYHIQVDESVPAILSGSRQVADQISSLLGIRAGQATKDGLFSLSLSRDIGAADIAPAIRVNDRYFGPMDADGAGKLMRSLRKGLWPRSSFAVRTGSSCSMLLGPPGDGAPADISAYLRRGGYEALAQARNMTPNEAADIVARSGLRGRGGADYPTAAKWRSLSWNGPVYLICNADEGEPGTFKDRFLIERRPHLVIEGIAIAAWAVGARRCFVYLRGEYRRGAALLTEAAAGAEREGLLEGLKITVHFGAGSYICGEETALIASLEGRRGVPAPKPPYPTERGLYGRPTIVNNTETLAALPVVFSRGPELFRRLSPRLFSVSGHVRRPGLYECPEGTPLADVIGAAGGVTGTLKAVFLGGISQPVLTAAEVSRLTLDRASCLRTGTTVGTGAVIVMNSSAPLREIAWRIADFFADESCGQCSPCREGVTRIRDILMLFRRGGGDGKDLGEIQRLGDALDSLSLCPAGSASVRSLATLTEKFHHDFTP